MIQNIQYLIFGNIITILKQAKKKIQLSDHLDNIIKEKMPDMLEQMFKNMISSSFYNLFSHMKNTKY